MITVAEYKRPKFEITFNSLKDAYKLGDQLTVSGIAKTYSGVNIENSKVTYTVQARTFDWGLQENMIAAGKTQTNAKGEFERITQYTCNIQRIRKLHSFRHGYNVQRGNSGGTIPDYYHKSTLSINLPHNP